MRVAPAPGCLPATSRVHLLETDAPAQLLARVLALLQPEATVTLGGPAPRGAALITCAPETAFAADAPAGLVYIPHVDRDTWPWWSFAERLIDRHKAGAPVEIDLSDFIAFLLDWPDRCVELRDGQIHPIPRHYAPWASLLSSRRCLELAAVRPRLGDERSQRHFDAVTRGDPPALWALYVENVYSAVQYFDYVTLNDGDVVLSIGVDEGFDTPYLLGLVGASGVVHHLDPFADDRLNPYPRRAVAARPHAARFHRVAVADKEGEAAMIIGRSGEAIGAAIGTEIDPRFKQERFPTVSLDGFVAAQGLTRVDYVKIDTEGAEPLILQGMGETIRRFRPQIALSIYHHPDHFWRLPQQLFALCPEYNFYLAHYSFMAWDTLLYAIPKERPVALPPNTPPLTLLKGLNHAS